MWTPRYAQGVGSRWSWILVMLVMLVSACGRDANEAATQQLLGRTFLSISVTESGEPRNLVDGTRIRLLFSHDGRISATAGCNTMGGKMEVDNGRLLVSDLSTTEMGCDAARHEQDTWLANLLTGVPRYHVSGSRLRLTSGATTIELLDRRVADPDRSLQRTTWQLDGTFDNDVAQSVPAGTTATIRLAESALTVSVQACGGASTPATFGEGTLTVTPFDLATGRCSADAAWVASLLTTLLDGTVAYQISADALTITAPSGRGMTFRAS